MAKQTTQTTPPVRSTSSKGGVKR